MRPSGENLNFIKTRSKVKNLKTMLRTYVNTRGQLQTISLCSNKVIYKYTLFTRIGLLFLGFIFGRFEPEYILKMILFPQQVLKQSGCEGKIF